MFEQPLPIAENPEKNRISPENPIEIDYESEIQAILDSGRLPAEIIETEEERFADCRNPEDLRKLHDRLSRIIKERGKPSRVMAESEEEQYQENDPLEKTAIRNRIAEMLGDPERLLGEGQVGKVFYIDNHNCCKYVHDLNRHREQNDITTEIDLQRDAWELSEKSREAKVPMPICKLSIDGRPAFVMERIDGLSLRMAESGKSLPENFDPDAFFDAAERFIDEMNASGLHHRDLHGGNVMIDWPTGKPVIIDFGIAKIGLPGRSEEDYRHDDPLSGEGISYEMDHDNARRLRLKYGPIFKKILADRNAIDK